jgi:hypothetical protein
MPLREQSTALRCEAKSSLRSYFYFCGREFHGNLVTLRGVPQLLFVLLLLEVGVRSPYDLSTSR